MVTLQYLLPSTEREEESAHIRPKMGNRPGIASVKMKAPVSLKPTDSSGVGRFRPGPKLIPRMPVGGPFVNLVALAFFKILG